jgi:hypothetical protein
MTLASRFLVCLLFCSTLLAQSNNPVPFVNQPLVPTSVVPGTKKFTLTINGTGFVPSSVVNWNGSARATVVLSTSSLQATITAADVAQETTGWVTVVNPSPGGGTSNVACFPVRQPAPSVAMDVDSGFSPNGANTVGDFNNDGKLDIAVASNPKPGIIEIDMYPGKGKGQFAAPVKTKFTHLLPRVLSVLAADFNGDGNLDLAVQGYGPCNTEIFLGNGHGKFSAKQNFGSICGAWAAVDFNGDGKLDLLIQGAVKFGCLAELLLGNGDGTFQLSSEVGWNDCSGGGLAIGDFDGDGTLDFAVAGGATKAIQVFLNFAGPVIYPVSYFAQGVTAADVNGDGILDLVSDGVSVLLGNGDGTFRKGSEFPIMGYQPVVADFNADGKVDIVVSSSANEWVLLGNGDGSFQTPIATRGPTRNEVAADFFRNGRLGLAFGGLGSANVFRQTDLGLFPSLMYFANQQVGSSSPPQTATLTNVEQTSAAIKEILINGANSQDYSQTNNCPASLPVNGSCEIQVTFTPKTTGYKIASLSVAYHGRGSPQTVTLNGTGVAGGTVSLTPSSLTFPVQLLNTTSKSQTATLANNGPVDLQISSIAARAPFGQTNNCPATLPNG